MIEYKLHTIGMTEKELNIKRSKPKKRGVRNSKTAPLLQKRNAKRYVQDDFDKIISMFLRRYKHVGEDRVNNSSTHISKTLGIGIMTVNKVITNYLELKKINVEFESVK